MTDLPQKIPHISAAQCNLLRPYLPPGSDSREISSLPFTTLTFDTSLDSALGLPSRTSTAIWGEESLAMSHYLRSQYNAILIGVNTAIVDDPKLNCRIDRSNGYTGQGLVHQPRPVILDPTARWDFSERSGVLATAKEGHGLAPYILTSVRDPPIAKKLVLERFGGKYITTKATVNEAGEHRFEWRHILDTLAMEALDSVMIEGGATVINSLLLPDNLGLISSVIVTIAPAWLGRGGAMVSPAQRLDENGYAMVSARLTTVRWLPFGEDVVLCGRISL
jgi:2,5-diamino-6-(ribosylamino)-4(3H)-pyrimidinone 5'-phosphate reductase